MKIPFFGELTTESLNDYYRIITDFNGRKLEFDINFENASIDKDNVNLLIEILENLSDWTEKAKEYINKEFKTGSEVDEYIEFYLEELFEEDFEILFKDADKTLSRREQIFSTLKLKRIGFYPENEKHYAIFDFAPDEESNQVLVVKINKNGELDHVTWES